MITTVSAPVLTPRASFLSSVSIRASLFTTGPYAPTLPSAVHSPLTANSTSLDRSSTFYTFSARVRSATFPHSHPLLPCPRSTPLHSRPYSPPTSFHPLSSPTKPASTSSSSSSSSSSTSSTQSRLSRMWLALRSRRYRRHQ